MLPSIDGPNLPTALPTNTPVPTPTPAPVPATPTGSYVLPTSYNPVQAPAPTWTTPPDSGFAASAKGQQPQWGLDTDLAKLASDVYNVPGDPSIGKWSRVDDATLLAAGIDPKSLDTPATGFRAAIYSDGQGRVVVAYAGTEFTSGQDWLNNVKQGLGLGSEAYDQAATLAQLAVQRFGAGNVVFAGHSLGGGEASLAAAVTGQPAVTFNAAGVSAATLDEHSVSPEKAAAVASNGQIRRYNVENDVLTNIQQNSGVASLAPDALGYEITLENPNSIEDPVRAHMCGTVLAAMESKDIKTQQNDSWLKKNVLEQNLFPMGPSVNDIWQTGGDVVDKAKDVGGKVISALNPFD